MATPESVNGILNVALNIIAKNAAVIYATSVWNRPAVVNIIVYL